MKKITILLALCMSFIVAAQPPAEGGVELNGVNEWTTDIAKGVNKLSSQSIALIGEPKKYS